MKENENLDNNQPEEKTENLDYSFDFGGQVDKPAETLEPVMPEAVPVEPVSMSEPVQPEVIVDPAPVMPEVAPVEPVVAPEPTLVDVSVPVMEETPAPVMEQTAEPVAEVQEEAPTKSGKSTVTFIIVLGVIVICFILALPFILKFLG